MIPVKTTLIAASVAVALSSMPTQAQPVADLAIANEDKLAQMLIKKGELSADASVEERRAAVQALLERKRKGGQIDSHNPDKKMLEQRSRVLKAIGKNRGHKQLRSAALTEPEMRTDKVLALLIDFPDLPWDDNGLTSEHTEMLYDTYGTDHYQDLLFSPAGYTGPNDENLISMRQYYEDESGETYSVDGAVYGWYRASEKAATYGGNSATTDNDINAQGLVREALDQLAKDPNINLADFDIEDRYDYDGDGNYREPDGMIDHLMVFHASVGEEAGGGVLGDDAIWSHRYNLGNVHALSGTSSGLDRFNGEYVAYDYTMQPIDAAAGVCTHEYGHDLGLPDEYDTQYTGQGEPVSYWSIMSSGSWAGKIGGTQPSAFSAWAKVYLQEYMGGNWINDQRFTLEELTDNPTLVTLHQTTDNSKDNLVRVDLPLKQVDGVAPFEGENHYYSNKGDDLNSSMSANLTVPTAGKVHLQFKAWFTIEKDYDFARVLINGEAIAGNITTMDDPYGTGLVPALSGSSDGWVDAEFDVTAWAGQDITLSFEYVTDGGLTEEGFYLDNLQFVADGTIEPISDAETDNVFSYNGYNINQGFHTAEHYYLLQWRSHNSVDEGLANIKRMDQIMDFQPGLLVWYVDLSSSDNWVGNHPGEGWLGVVDADQNALLWANDNAIAQTRYQMRDATFSLQAQTPFTLTASDGNQLIDSNLEGNHYFSDDQDYSSPQAPDSGRLLTEKGLSVEIVEQEGNNEYAIIRLNVKGEEPTEPDNIAPVAKAKVKHLGRLVMLKSKSSDEDGKIVSTTWTLPNGKVKKGRFVLHVFPTKGEKVITLTVTDDDGAVTTKEITLNL